MKMPKTIYRGRVFDLTLQERRLPDGRRVCPEIIVHPGASLMVPFLDHRHVIFLRQFRTAINGWLYELPAGTPEKNETFLDCARRELREETGYKAKTFRLLGKIYPVPGYSTEKIMIYEARELTFAPKAKDAEELIETRILTKPRVRDMLKAGQLVDAKTICALSFCGWL